MKPKFLLIILSILFLSCEPRIKNNIDTLDKVFEKSEIDMQISNWGCFGGSDELFTLKKIDKGYLLKSKRTSKSLVLTNGKRDSLYHYMKNRMGKVNEYYCTSSQYIRIGDFFNSVDYKHNDCSEEREMLNKILGYYELIYSENEG
tara:strand:+ start:16589 stop:17026 length:438 start_codon:yes stop_codon:yes gene_type:complete